MTKWPCDPQALAAEALTFFPKPDGGEVDVVVEVDRAVVQNFVANGGDVHDALSLAKVYVEEYTPLARAGFEDPLRAPAARSLTKAIERYFKEHP
jgi:hypothetical protein